MPPCWGLEVPALPPGKFGADFEFLFCAGYWTDGKELTPIKSRTHDNRQNIQQDGKLSHGGVVVPFVRWLVVANWGQDRRFNHGMHKE
jgi:hypothetical protein